MKSKTIHNKNSKSAIKHSAESKLNLNKNHVRWATNELVANWRANRLKCDRIADLGCGIGFQSFAFAKKCSKVIAVDINIDKIEDAKKTGKKLNMSNIDFHCGDVLSKEIMNNVKGCQIVFLDPHREPTENVRTIDSIKPNINEFLKSYDLITNKIAIEFPPQIKEFPENCEREYASVYGKLNRLTLYFGDLKKNEVSAVSLPSNEVISRDYSTPTLTESEPLKYIYEIDSAVQKADLLAELAKKTHTKLLENKKHTLFTSEDLIENSFFRISYIVKEICNQDELDIINNLKKHGFGKVLVRYPVNPEEYWTERKKYEHYLFGDKQATLFKVKNIAIICETIK